MHSYHYPLIQWKHQNGRLELRYKEAQEKSRMSIMSKQVRNERVLGIELVTINKMLFRVTC